MVFTELDASLLSNTANSAFDLEKSELTEDSGSHEDESKSSENINGSGNDSLLWKAANCDVCHEALVLAKCKSCQTNFCMNCVYEHQV